MNKQDKTPRKIRTVKTILLINSLALLAVLIISFFVENTTVYADSDTQGSRNQGKAAMAAFTSAVISCTAIGAAATGIF
ncbi:MAG: hypothetical protein MSL09_05180 [Spirochaetia bacterium]|nr:hypothetical protein [Spirochaetia bacterium]